ncbi:chondroitin sulfate proteoglycan 5-like isoform X1, partial [Clarias magur]
MMSCRSFTVLLSSLLLFHLLPLHTHGSLLASNDTLFNSSHAASNMMAVKPATPVSSSHMHAHRRRAAEEPGSSGLDEHQPHFISADSADPEHRVDLAVGGMGAGLPTLFNREAQLDFTEENAEDAVPRWHSEVLRPDGSVLDLGSRPPSHERSLFLSESDDSSPIIKVSFSKPDQSQQLEIPPLEAQGGDPTSWTLLDYYDYLSPEYSTTDSYSDDGQVTPSDMEDENVPRVKKAGPDEGTSNLAGTPGAMDRAENGRCLLGFVHKNGTCQSPCDIYTSYCFNGGQCYVLEGTGAFCRCNVQDYVWNRGARCEAVVTEFQVMCAVVSAVSLTLLVLFMLIVFFSKRLHLLKIENRQLRKRSRSRPQSEQHNDNFSLSTVAEGSQTNKDFSKHTWECKPCEESCSENDVAKPEEPVKTPVKEEDESLNIQNSLTSKVENNIDLRLSADEPEE